MHYMSASADVGLLLLQMQCRPNSHSYSSSRVLLRGWNGGLPWVLMFWYLPVGYSCYFPLFDVYLFATHVILNGVSSKMISHSDISLQGEAIEVSIQSDVDIWRIRSTHRKKKRLGLSEALPVVSEKDGT